MKTLLKVFTAVAALTFATAAFADVATVSLGQKDASSSIEIDWREYGYGYEGASFFVACNDETIFVADVGGVTYVAPGVSYWVDSNGFYHLSQLPEGEYTGGVGSWSGTFWTSGSNVTWQGPSGQYWLAVDFY